MQHRSTSIILLSVFALINLARLDPDQAQSTQKFSTLNLALQDIRQTYGVSTGFEAAGADRDQTPITIELSNPTVGNVFDSIILQKPNYTWIYQEGVYDIYPKNQAECLSGLQISSYSVAAATPQEASDAITRLPEVQSWLAQNHLTRNEIKSTTGWPKMQTISLTLNNIPLRTLLNQLARKAGDESWNAFRWGDKMQFVAIYF
jgi:hypothetical protein